MKKHYKEALKTLGFTLAGGAVGSLVLATSNVYLAAAIGTTSLILLLEAVRLAFKLDDTCREIDKKQ